MPNSVQLFNCITVGFLKSLYHTSGKYNKVQYCSGLFSFAKAMINQVSFFKGNWTKNMAVTVALGKHKTLLSVLCLTESAPPGWR